MGLSLRVFEPTRKNPITNACLLLRTSCPGHVRTCVPLQAWAGVVRARVRAGWVLEVHAYVWAGVVHARIRGGLVPSSVPPSPPLNG